MRTLREVAQILGCSSARQIINELAIQGQGPVPMRWILAFDFIDAVTLRGHIVVGTQTYTAYFGSSQNYLGLDLNEPQIDSFFTGPAPWNTDCQGAARIIMARGLILSLNPGEFDKLGYTSSNMHLEFRPITTSDQMLIGEWAYFKNDPHYLEKHPDGGYQGENVIKVSDTVYYGFPGGTNTEQEWDQELINAYNAGLPSSEQINSVPGFMGAANERFDLQAINVDVWKLRNLIRI